MSTTLRTHCCVSLAIMVTRTRHNVTLYVHCLCRLFGVSSTTLSVTKAVFCNWQISRATSCRFALHYKTYPPYWSRTFFFNFPIREQWKKGKIIKRKKERNGESRENETRNLRFSGDLFGRNFRKTLTDDDDVVWFDNVVRSQWAVTRQGDRAKSWEWRNYYAMSAGNRWLFIVFGAIILVAK